jgi:3-keto-L-gulonate-6-phosphate decarboxylase
VTRESAEAEFNRQMEEATHLREFAYSIVGGKHDGNFTRKDYIGLSLFNRCLQTHQATEIVAKHSLIDDAWVLVRALAEHAVNCVYMLVVADAQTADDYADYADYLSYTTLLDLKSTNEAALRRVVSVEEEEKNRLRYEAVRSRFDGKRGDKWCVDDALYRRAARVDRTVTAAGGEERSDLLWLVNSVWRYASTYTHGTAGALAAQVKEDAEGVTIHRKYTHEEAARVLHAANLALYLAVLPVDVRLGGKNIAELNRRLQRWAAEVAKS